MTADNHARLRKILSEKETEELLEIWVHGSTAEWEEEAFAAAREILLERGVDLPAPSPDRAVRGALEIIATLYDAGRLEEALAECERALAAAPDVVELHSYRGWINEDLGRPEQALEDHRRAMALAPEDAGIRTDFSAVEKRLEVDFLASPAKARLDGALELVYEGQVEAAWAELEAVRAGLPGLARAYNYVGLIRLELEDYRAAGESFQEALEFNPRCSAARQNLAYARKRQVEENYRRAGMLTAEETPEQDDWWREYDEEHLDEIPDRAETLPGWMYLNEEAWMLRGFPGFRNRPGRFGTDPLDSDFEEAHAEGYLLKKIVTLRLRTRNPLNLLAMTLAGLSFLTAAIWPLLSSFLDPFLAIFACLCAPFSVGGLLLLANVVMSLVQPAPRETDDRGEIFY